MFWGLIMEPHRRYTQVVKKAFHISMAALDVSTSGDEHAQVMCGFEGRNYLLCTLKKGEILQCALDLSFEVGSEVSFATNGISHVHLTGYLIDEDQLDLGEEAEEEEEDEYIEVNNKSGSVKRSKNDMSPSKKKSKTEILLDTTLDSHDESDDSDVNLSDLMEEDDDEGEDDELGEEDDSEEDDDDDEELSSMSEEEASPKPKQNGVALKRDKRNKQAVESPIKGQKQKDKAKGNNETKGDKNKESPKKDVKSPGKATPQKKTIEGGVVIEELKPGNGAPAKTGSFVTVYYEGRLKNNNKMFDSTTKGPGFKFRLGKREVIKGWDVGLIGLKVGGKRRITCPPNMAYGPKGSPPIVPPNATLVFDVELKNAN